ncbi:MAG: hypothetical protein J6R27_06475 [Muribaculaceae bacterium]|nr:hypothetical protein [Muribaculaceae bacterium]
MKRLFNISLSLLALALCASCESGSKHSSSACPEATKGNSIYHWKGTFDLDSTEIDFIHKHQIERLYLRMFDVATEQNYELGGLDIVPIATTKFISDIPDNVEIVPVTYITIGALRAITDKEEEYAYLISERLLAMSSYNNCGTIREVQLDCDWTKSTKDTYTKLCQTVKNELKSQNIDLSITVRLHQLNETPPPADRGVLMLYNTGAIKNPATKNSILDIADAKPYLRKTKYPIPLDYAYPAFGWGVKFEYNEFACIVSENDSTSEACTKIRYERPTSAEIIEIKQLVEKKIGKPNRGNILYHLDDSQLKNYTDDEISTILSI